MKLYTNGCSFTQGHKEHTIIQSPCGLVKNDVKKDAPWAWPRQLEPYFDEVINEGWCGGSNDRVVRRSIEFLSQVDTPSDWCVILQITEPDRSEWYDSDSNTWIGQLNHRQIYDDRAWNKEGINRKLIEKKSMHNITNRAFVGSDLQTMYNLLYRIVSFEHVCSNLGITRILYGAMSGRCNLAEIYHLCKYPTADLSSEVNIDTYHFFHSLDNSDKQGLTTLINQIPVSRYLTPMSFITKGHEESPTDAHPNQVGHRLFADYILREMKTREIL